MRSLSSINFKSKLQPALSAAGIFGSIGGFIADVLTPLGPVLQFLFYGSLAIFIISTFLIITISKSYVEILKSTMLASLFFSIIFGLFSKVNTGTENGILGDNFESISAIQNSLSIIDNKIDLISDDIRSVSDDIKDVKEIISGDSEIKNMSTSEDLNVTKELNERTNDDDIKRIAILYFSNSGEVSKLKMLKKGLADMMISDLSNINMLNIVERDKIEQIIKEQKLSNSSDFDPKTATKLGKLLGAEIILTGSFFEMFGSMRIDARFIDVSTGEILKSDGVDGESSKFFKIQKQLTWKIIKNLDAKISENEINALNESENNDNISFDDVNEYGIALDHYDNERYNEAVMILNKILVNNPDFLPAKKLLIKLKV